MAFVNKQDTDGTKSILLKGELGLDLVPDTDDYGTLYVGDGISNLAINGKTAKPVITIASSVLENSSNIGTIVNYDASTSYTIEVGDGSGTIAYGGGNTFTFVAPDVSATDTVNISSYASKAGEQRSNLTINSVIVNNVPIVADDAYVDNLVVDDSTYNSNWEVV